jgi:hypothetical protein
MVGYGVEMQMSNVLHIAYTIIIVLQEVVFSKYTLSSQMFLFCVY